MGFAFCLPDHYFAWTNACPRGVRRSVTPVEISPALAPSILSLATSFVALAVALKIGWFASGKLCWLVASIRCFWWSVFCLICLLNKPFLKLRRIDR